MSYGEFFFTINGEQRRMPTWAGLLAWALLFALGPGVWLLGVVAAVYLLFGGLR